MEYRHITKFTSLILLVLTMPFSIALVIHLLFHFLTSLLYFVPNSAKKQQTANRGGGSYGGGGNRGSNRNSGGGTGNLQEDITREEFCSIAVKIYEALSGKLAEPSAVNPFTDTSGRDILKAYEQGIVKGVSPDSFAPNSKITRQEICVMIYRAIKAAKPGLNFEVTGVAAFNDEAQIASWAINEVRFASKNNIMKGTGNNNISPLIYTSRQEGIVLIKRAYEAFINN